MRDVGGKQIVARGDTGWVWFRVVGEAEEVIAGDVEEFAAVGSTGFGF